MWWLWLASTAWAGVFGSEPGTLTGAYVMGSMTRAAFNDYVAPGWYELPGVGVGATGGSLQDVMSLRGEAAMHTRWKTPDALLDTVPDGYELQKRYLSASVYVGLLLDGVEAGGPYLEAGAYSSFPVSQSLRFERATLSFAGGGGERWIFGNGLIVDAGLRVQSPRVQPDSVSFPLVFMVRVGGGSVL